MKRLLACSLILGFLWGVAPGWTDEPAEAPALAQSIRRLGPVPTLEQRLDALEQLDEELAEAQRQLETSTTTAARRELKARIRELQATQDTLFEELEAIVGPLPPAVRHEPPTQLEQQLEAQQRHYEAILESDVERRLPSE